MVPSASLCSYCEKISFDALRGPSKADIEDLGDGEPGERFIRTAIERQVKVGLGTLNRILRDASSCTLCSLFYRIIKRQGAAYQSRSALKTLDSDDIQFRADPDLSYYARITLAEGSSSPSFVLRRLNLTAHARLPVDNHDWNSPVALFDHVLQVCNRGTLSAVPNNNTPMSTDWTGVDMLFGGRKRSPTIDLQLLRRWMTICTNEHERSCSLSSTQTESIQ